MDCFARPIKTLSETLSLEHFCTDFESLFLQFSTWHSAWDFKVFLCTEMDFCVLFSFWTLDEIPEL